MVLDARANILCNLGTVLNGEISDDPLTEGGLVRTNGSLVLDGVQMPTRGTVVRLAYHRPQTQSITLFPRAMRVLKAVADPYKRLTTLDLGCKLTLMQDKQDEGAMYYASRYEGLTRTRVALASISAQAMLQYCMLKVGITLAAGSAPLESRFVRSSVDLSEGYLAMADALLKSECRYAYLNISEELVVRRVDLTEASLATVLRDEDVVDMTPIGSSDDAPTTVKVSYSAISVTSG